MGNTRTIHEVRIVGVPMDLGAGRRGVDMGPSAIRFAGLSAGLRSLGNNVKYEGNISVPIPESRTPGQGLKYYREIVKVCNALAQRVEKIIDADAFPIVLGGDHSIAMGTVSGISNHYRKKNQSVGLIYVDAHGDMNTPDTSPSGNIHGMPLAALLGIGPSELTNIHGFSPKIKKENTALIGIRAIDRKEREVIKQSGVRVFTMREIDERGIGEVMPEVLDIVSDGTAGFHLSFDLDGLDPEIAPGVGTPVRGGINFREAHTLMEMIADSHRMVGLEMVELNPILDNRNTTGELAVDLILSAVGQSIL